MAKRFLEKESDILPFSTNAILDMEALLRLLANVVQKSHPPFGRVARTHLLPLRRCKRWLQVPM